ncbi:MAG: hypothetical protein HZA90_19500 [Verrucomicrobia bacterium]|nr:hypothetical protein [Verrucomicrobiota bacterium]
MRKPLVVNPEALERLASLSQASRQLCLDAIFGLVEAFGRPHVHSGLSIRKLRPSVFECRAGLDLRILFRDRPESLQVAFIGTHDEVQHELKRGKYG